MRFTIQTLGNRISQRFSGAAFRYCLATSIMVFGLSASRADYIAYGSVVRHYSIPNGGQPIANAKVTIYDSKTGRTIGTMNTDINGRFQIYCKTPNRVPVGNHHIRAASGKLSGDWGREMISIDPRRPRSLGVRPH